MLPDVLDPAPSPPDAVRPRAGRSARPGEVLRQSLRLQRRSLLAWCAGLAAMVVLYGSLWPSIRDEPSITDVMDQLPEVLRSLLATADMSTPVGYVQAELMGLTGPLLVILFAVLAGAAGIAGEEDRRSIDLLLANPVSRTRVVVERTAATVVATAVVVTALGVALAAGGVLFGLDLPLAHVLAAMLHLWLLGAVFGALAAAVGAATGSVALARAVPAATAVLAYLVNGLAPLVGWLEPVRDLSPFAQYQGHVPLASGVSWPAVAVSAGTVLVLGVVAVSTFRRRDLRG
ncbi:ABC transporter permease [Blastococcus sp. TML/M2B]|uniref:ABC transporter permease n=1 Tax=unclassified Blastococcus TaxID=2619396 RepID=UPI00190DEB38|nr:MULTISPECIES: ABC transporter permease [unclassified Blastococcus]MBN1093232.1 ABC transporter permease [Blastococcus sp. TML/M2B]MBN1096657.1 ABC transporter permease [Blastococcus sp. TML/C7B]